MTASEERSAVVAMMRRMVCEAVAGSTKPAFLCKTPAKASAVLSFAFSKVAEAIENGEHLEALASKPGGEGTSPEIGREE